MTKSFLNTQEVLNLLNKAFYQHHKKELRVLIIKESELSLKDAVSTYLFNSQIISTGPNEMTLIAPQQCKTKTSTQKQNTNFSVRIA